MNLVSLIGISGLILLVSSFPAQATPPVHWSQSAVNASISRGGHTEIIVSLNAVKAIGNVDIRIVPEIDLYVDVSPSMLSNVKAGDTIPIRISIQADTAAPLGLFDGTIQVREKVTRRGKGKVLARPLPVHVLIREEEGVASVDADGNGVWDYIDQYINDKYPGADNDRLRSASRQYARAIQGGLLNADNKAISLQYAEASDRATECMFFLRPQDADEVLSDLEAIILNTQTRSKAFLMFSEQSAGQIFPSVPFSQRSASCVDE